MLFRVLVFGDLHQSDTQIEETVERLRHATDPFRPWATVIPRCHREILQVTNFDRLDDAQLNDALIRCSALLDLEGFGDGQEEPDLILGLGQGATFVAMAFNAGFLAIPVVRCLLVGGKNRDLGHDRNVVPSQPTVRVILVTRPEDLIVACPLRDRARLDQEYKEGRQQLVGEMLKERLWGYTQLKRGDVEEILDRHRQLVVTHEEQKHRARSSVSPFSILFAPEDVVADLVTAFRPTIDDPEVQSVAATLIGTRRSHE